MDPPVLSTSASYESLLSKVRSPDNHFICFSSNLLCKEAFWTWKCNSDHSSDKKPVFQKKRVAKEKIRSDLVNTELSGTHLLTLTNISQCSIAFLYFDKLSRRSTVAMQTLNSIISQFLILNNFSKMGSKCIFQDLKTFRL